MLGTCLCLFTKNRPGTRHFVCDLHSHLLWTPKLAKWPFYQHYSMPLERQGTNFSNMAHQKPSKPNLRELFGPKLVLSSKEFNFIRYKRVAQLITTFIFSKNSSQHTSSTSSLVPFKTHNFSLQYKIPAFTCKFWEQVWRWTRYAGKLSVQLILRLAPCVRIMIVSLHKKSPWYTTLWLWSAFAPSLNIKTR